jgi:glutaredoxin 3
MDHLENHAVVILRVKRAGAVAVGFDITQDLDSMALEPGVPGIHGVGVRKSESQMIKDLGAGHGLVPLAAVNGQIVETVRSEVDVVGVRFPLDGHFEDPGVKLFGGLRIAHVECGVTESKGFQLRGLGLSHGLFIAPAGRSREEESCMSAGQDKKVVVYTMDYCPYCERAKSLLGQRGVPFTEVRVAEDNDAEWDRLEKLTGLKTMPQILHGDRVIGGYIDLAALDREDQLRSLKST